MNTADIIILAVLGLSVLFGLWRGLVAEVLALVCWVAAFWVAWRFGGVVAAWYAQWLQAPSARIVAGYLTCFLGVLIVGGLIGWAMRKVIRGGGLSGADRMFGMVFGFVRGVLLVTVIVWVLNFTFVPNETWWRQSRLIPGFMQSASWLSQELPPQTRQYVENGARALPRLPAEPISVPKFAVPVALPAPATSQGNAKTEPDRHHPDGDVGQ